MQNVCIASLVLSVDVKILKEEKQLYLATHFAHSRALKYR